MDQKSTESLETTASISAIRETVSDIFDIEPSHSTNIFDIGPEDSLMMVGRKTDEAVVLAASPAGARLG